MIYFLLILLGLGVGSFLNVITFRYREDSWILGGHAILGRSRCSHCRKVLKWYELLPLLSFVFQRGKCRLCRKRISSQYPLIELLTAFIFVIIPYYFFFSSNIFFLSLSLNWLIIFSIVWILVFTGLLALAVIDYREYLIPNEIIIYLVAFSVIWTLILTFIGDTDFSGSFLQTYSNIFGLRNNALLNHVFSGILGALLVVLVFLVTKGKAIGFGDVKLFGALGLLFGWPDVILIFFLSFIVGAIFSIPLLIRGTKGMKDFVPFAPFIVIASFLVFYLGNDIMKVYFSLFSIS